MRSMLKLAGVCMLLAATAACATGAPSLRDDGLSPRNTTLNAVDKVEPVLEEVTKLIETGSLSDNVVDDIAQFGPVVRDLLTAYLDATEACVVIDGALVTDVSAGRDCRKSTLRRAFAALDGEIYGWALASGVDSDAGKLIYAVRLIASLTTKPASGDIVSGYRKEADIPLDQFQTRRGQVRGVFDAMLAAASAQARRDTPAPAPEPVADPAPVIEAPPAGDAPARDPEATPETPAAVETPVETPGAPIEPPKGVRPGELVDTPPQ